MKPAAILAPLALGVVAIAAGAATVRVRNDFGDITIRGDAGAQQATFKTTLRARRPRPDDVKHTEGNGIVLIECQPADRARIDLEVTVPHTAFVEVEAKTAWVTVTGLVRSVNVVTESSPIRLEAPWRLMRVTLLSVTVPLVVRLPETDYVEFPAGIRQGYWTLVDAPPGFIAGTGNPKEPLRSPTALDQGMPLRGWLYGHIRVRGNSISRIELADQPLAADSWVQPPDLAPALAERMLRPEGAPAPGVTAAPPASAPINERLPRFTARVSMVNLIGPVYDERGKPAPGLGPEDFEVIEDGVPQKVAVAASEEVPFNLILLLDFSTSALRSRYVLEQAARGFLEIARPQDRVAVYALADGLFQVIVPLSATREGIIEKITAVPRLGGTSPVYDALVLAYAQENLIASRERTAIVFITDGIDNSLHGPAGGSKTAYETLLRLVSGAPVLIYPVLLPPPAAQRPFAASRAVIETAPEARRRMQEMADRTGGRLFAADSTFSMKPVYPLIAQELEKVYAVAYYPRNQERDGRWRRVEVRVRRPGVTFRTREGYYAR